jgi:acyl-coenzyme A synthetase/AMP-(fatty) acid ligase
MFPFYVGASTILFPSKAQATAVLEVVQRTRPTLFFSVPTLYAQMLQEAEKESYRLGSVRLAVSAAEPLPAEIYRRFRSRFGVEILDGLGSTEVLHMYLSARPGNVKPGSTGAAVPGYKLRLVDMDEREVPPGTIGDLLLQVKVLPLATGSAGSLPLNACEGNGSSPATSIGSMERAIIGTRAVQTICSEFRVSGFRQRTRVL